MRIGIFLILLSLSIASAEPLTTSTVATEVHKTTRRYFNFFNAVGGRKPRTTSSARAYVPIPTISKYTDTSSSTSFHQDTISTTSPTKDTASRNSPPKEIILSSIPFKTPTSRSATLQGVALGGFIPKFTTALKDSSSSLSSKHGTFTSAVLQGGALACSTPENVTPNSDLTKDAISASRNSLPWYNRPTGSGTLPPWRSTETKPPTPITSEDLPPWVSSKSNSNSPSQQAPPSSSSTRQATGTTTKTLTVSVIPSMFTAGGKTTDVVFSTINPMDSRTGPAPPTSTAIITGTPPWLLTPSLASPSPRVSSTSPTQPMITTITVVSTVTLPLGALASSASIASVSESQGRGRSSQTLTSATSTINDSTSRLPLTSSHTPSTTHSPSITPSTTSKYSIIATSRPSITTSPKPSQSSQPKPSLNSSARPPATGPPKGPPNGPPPRGAPKGPPPWALGGPPGGPPKSPPRATIGSPITSSSSETSSSSSRGSPSSSTTSSNNIGYLTVYTITSGRIGSYLTPYTKSAVPSTRARNVNKVRRSTVSTVAMTTAVSTFKERDPTGMRKEKRSPNKRSDCTTDNWGNCDATHRKIVIIRSSKDAKDDVSADFEKGLKEANHGGMLVLEKGKVYMIAKKLDLSWLNDVYVKLEGEIRFTDDVKYWQANNFYYDFQKSITFWVWGGKNIKIFGGGTINGNGQRWWNEFADKGDILDPSNTYLRPILFLTDKATNIEISNIYFLNPPSWNTFLVRSKNVVFDRCRFDAISNSKALPKNTDGFDSLNVDGLTVTNTVLNVGDDCFSPKPNSSNIHVENVWCNGTHGISMGSIGQYPGIKDYIENVYIKNVTLTNGQNGARLKAWAGKDRGYGYIRNITYEDIYIENTHQPVLLDQCYINISPDECQRYPSRVNISNIRFINIRGTSSGKRGNVVASLKCSLAAECSNIELRDVNISPMGKAAGQKGVILCDGIKGGVGVPCVSSENPKTPKNSEGRGSRPIENEDGSQESLGSEDADESDDPEERADRGDPDYRPYRGDPEDRPDRGDPDYRPPRDDPEDRPNRGDPEERPDSEDSDDRSDSDDSRSRLGSKDSQDESKNDDSEERPESEDSRDKADEDDEEEDGSGRGPEIDHEDRSDNNDLLERSQVRWIQR